MNKLLGFPVYLVRYKDIKDTWAGAYGAFINRGDAERFYNSLDHHDQKSSEIREVTE